MRIQWERWGHKAQETDTLNAVSSIVLTADTTQIAGRILDFFRYLRLQVTNSGATAATLTAGFDA